MGDLLATIPYFLFPFLCLFFPLHILTYRNYWIKDNTLSSWRIIKLFYNMA